MHLFILKTEVDPKIEPQSGGNKEKEKKGPAY
jgi:hypothetical protein